MERIKKLYGSLANQSKVKTGEILRGRLIVGLRNRQVQKRLKRKSKEDIALKMCTVDPTL